MIPRRRLILGVGGLTAITSLSYRFFSAQIAGLIGRHTNSLQMSEHHWSTIGILINHVLPKTDTTPSAIDAGVLGYLQRALSGDVKGWKMTKTNEDKGNASQIVPGYSHLVGHYIKTSERLDFLSKGLFNQEFIKLSLHNQSQIVEKFAVGASADVGYNVKGAPSLIKATDKSLFELVRRHALEGYFSDPANGGNTNYVAWESIRHICHMNYPNEHTNCPVHEM